MSKWNETLYNRRDDPGDIGHFNKDFSRHNTWETASGGPKWRAYKNYTVRKKSFYNADKSLRQRAGDLARSGFYFKGYGLWIACFFCGMEMEGKDDHYDPYTSHKDQAQHCGFIQNLRQTCTVEEHDEETTQQITPTIEQSANFDRNIQISQEASATTGVPMDTEESVDRMLACKVCLVGQVEVTFQPCGHLAACSACASRLDKCPVCRARIEHRIKTYLS